MKMKNLRPVMPAKLNVSLFTRFHLQWLHSVAKEKKKTFWKYISKHHMSRINSFGYFLKFWLSGNNTFLLTRVRVIWLYHIWFSDLFSGNLYIKNKLSAFSQKSYFITYLNKCTKIMITLSFLLLFPCLILSHHQLESPVPRASHFNLAFCHLSQRPADFGLHTLHSFHCFQPQAPEALTYFHWRHCQAVHTQLTVLAVPLSGRPPPTPPHLSTSQTPKLNQVAPLLSDPQGSPLLHHSALHHT